MNAAGTVVKREDLVRTVLGREFSPYDRSIDTHVCNLRRKIGRLTGWDRTHQRHSWDGISVCEVCFLRFFCPPFSR